MDIKYLRNVALYLLSAVLSLLFIGYILYHMTGSGEEDIDTDIAYLTTTAEGVSLDAYILRDETILYGPSDSISYYLVNDGESVRLGQTVANIYSGSKNAMNSIMSLEKRLNLLKSSNLSENSTGSTSTIDSQIRTLHQNMISDLENGSLSYTEQNKDDLLIQINRRKISVKSVSNYNTAIRACQSEKDALMAQFSAATETVTAAVSGNFYASADGYEAVFTQDAAETMTYDDFYTMISAEADQSLLTRGNSTAIGKLVTNSYWSVCCEISNDYIRTLKEGQTYPVAFSYNGGILLDMTLDRIITRYGEDYSVLVLGTRQSPQGFNYLRTQSIRLIFGEYSGYKVPAAAVRFVDGEMGVYISSANRVRFRKIEVLYEVDGYYVVAVSEDSNALQLYDEIIVQGKNLYDGKYLE